MLAAPATAGGGAPGGGGGSVRVRLGVKHVLVCTMSSCCQVPHMWQNMTIP